MPRLRSWIFVSLALVIFPLNGLVFGATRPTAAQRCAAAKIAAAAKKARADLACRARGALAGGPPDSACLLKAQQAFDAALSRAERRGGCVAPGDAGNVAAAIDRGVADLAADTTGQCTAGCVEGCSGSFDTCRWSGQTCGCGGSLNSCALECSLIGTSGFCANVGDVCDLGTCSCVAGSRSLPCDAQKLEATGQELRAELLCQAKATTSGGPVDPACITKAETTFGHAFDTAEKAGGCAVTGNALGVEDAIIPWANGIANVSGLGCGWLLQAWNTGAPRGPWSYDIAVDGSGNVFVSDQFTKTVVKYAGNGRIISETSVPISPGSGLDNFSVDSDGTIFAVDFGDGRIIKLTNSSETSWPIVSSYVDTDSILINDIATDANGYVYVAAGGRDSGGNSRGFVQKYGNNGAFLTEFGGDLLSDARAIAVGPDGRIFVAESWDGPSRIVEFRSDGTSVEGWWIAQGLNHLAVDPCGNVLMTTFPGDGIAKYTADGSPITTWSGNAPGDTAGAAPNGIAVDGSGNIWTIDVQNAAVKEFSCPCTP